MANKERIFIALRPDVESCRNLIEIQQRILINGRMMPSESLHLTLAFLGDCDPPRKQCVLDRVASIKATPFEMQLDTFGYFAHHRIFYITLNIVPIELLSLRQQLHSTLAPCRFKAAGTFKPHVTLFRGVKTPPFCDPLTKVVRWQVHSVCVERSELSETGARYTILKEQPL